jgi:hypothetical protein
LLHSDTYCSTRLLESLDILTLAEDLLKTLYPYFSTRLLENPDIITSAKNFLKAQQHMQDLHKAQVSLLQHRIF